MTGSGFDGNSVLFGAFAGCVIGFALGVAFTAWGFDKFFFHFPKRRRDQ